MRTRHSNRQCDTASIQVDVPRPLSDRIDYDPIAQNFRSPKPMLIQTNERFDGSPSKVRQRFVNGPAMRRSDNAIVRRHNDRLVVQLTFAPTFIQTLVRTFVLRIRFVPLCAPHSFRVLALCCNTRYTRPFSAFLVSLGNNRHT